MEDIWNNVDQFFSSFSNNRRAVGVGVGSPGPRELPAGRLHNPPNLPGWDGFDLRAAMEERLQIPVIVDGDANAAALAEFTFGSGKLLAVDSLCMLTLGTGVGSGIVLNGQLWHGSAGMAGEAGHLTINPEGPICGCGNTGCLEAYASATALTRAAGRLIAMGRASSFILQKSVAASLTAGELATAARQGDPDAEYIYAEAGRALGIGMAALINMLNLPLYVVGGGVAQSWDLISPALFGELQRRSYVYRLTAAGGRACNGMPGGGTQILPAKLGPEAGLLGACILPLHAMKL